MGRQREHDAGEARATLSDVAARAGVSPSTASIAFSGQGPVSDSTKARVLAAAVELGYTGPDPLARSLRTGRSGIVGALIPRRIGTSFRDPVVIQTLDGLAEELGGSGSGLLLLSERERETDRLSLEAAPIDALVLLGCGTASLPALDVLRRRGIPVVTIEGDEGAGVANIDVDNRRGTRVLAEHLRDLGHRDVALVTLPLTTEDRLGPLSEDEIASATATIAVRRIAGARDVFPGAAGISASGSTIADGRAAGRLLLDVPESDRPTAIIAQSDLLAAGVIFAAHDLGLAVPDDLSVVGFDGIRVDELPMRLTTVAQSAQDKGAAAGRAVTELLDGGHPESRCFPVTFQAGATTGPPAS
ncbi:LacI family DNA-binding transcriptional regulator [Labedella endophytica]|uniref:LacI family transcriptional regulator n=1 Tax=Labedella endophytica TaxID=1523160 RepID=A0A3S1CPT7_9MICO|nr:LacI family DNA-binding transcriptional regulator [Labedella endophytica]RUQ98027.1 LacI family transcriptional regulator [Labedella endophytica]